MDKDNRDDFTFATLSNLKVPVTFRINQLEGTRRPYSLTELLENPELRFHGVQSSTLSDLYVTCQLVADNKPLTIPFRTSFKAFKNSYTWNEWITLPIRYCDLPLNAQITFTVWDIAGPRNATPVGGSTLRLFGKKWTLRRGKHRLLLWQGVEADGSAESSTPSKRGSRDEMGRLEKLVKKYERGDLPKSEWLDKMTFRKMEEVHAAETQKSESLYLYVDLPRFDFPIIYNEPEATNLPSTSNLPIQPAQTPVATPSSAIHDSNLWSIVDPEVVRENPVEDKHRRLVRSHRSGPYDRELKPNAKIRDTIGEILNYAPSQPLNSEEKDVIWKFRFYLARDKRGLTKFLKSVTWRDPSEVKQAVEELLPQWSEIDIDDALELLGPGTVDSRVRAFAVRQLSRADDEELLLYLLQLVQALKFESAASEQRSSRSATNAISYDDSGLTDFMISRGVKNTILGSRLYWYLMVEVALEDRVIAKMYGRVVYKFLSKVLEAPNGAERRELMRRQGQLVETLAKRAREIRTSKDPRPKKIEKLRAVINDSKNNLLSFPPLPLPLNAQIEVVGINPEKSSVFKSNLYPFLLYFQCSDGSEYPVIFKDGDDMRQDQLVIQLFTLMDRLLRKENLDLKLSAYDVLATGPLQGMMQFIASKSIAAIVSEHGTLLNYMRANYPDEGSVGTSGVEPGVIDTFVRSCAGYCVVTYILGVGDRHLDNLLVAPDGHFFHVDFGYIMGRDPKPFPPAVKVCKEMVDGMGGAQSPHYARFKNFCFTAFTILRKNANLILNLVALMVDANIPDIKHRDVHEQLQEKFRLDLTEEEAIKHFETLLNETSYITVVLDRIHDLAQYWRDEAFHEYNKFTFHHPLVLLSVTDHHAHALSRTSNKRVVSVLLGQDNGKTINVANIFAIPFEEDEKESKTWFLDHNYIQGMYEMFKKVNAKERMIGWYHSGPKLRQEINDLFKKFIARPMMVIVDVRPEATLGIPTDAYFGVEEIKDKRIKPSSTYRRPLSRGSRGDWRRASATRHQGLDVATRVSEQLSSLRGLSSRLSDLKSYLTQLSSPFSTTPIPHQIIYYLQDTLDEKKDAKESKAEKSDDKEKKT